MQPVKDRAVAAFDKSHFAFVAAALKQKSSHSLMMWR